MGREHLGDLGVVWDDNIKINLKLSVKLWAGFIWRRIGGPEAGSCKDKGPSHFIKM
jgi:hypothetical protein